MLSHLNNILWVLLIYIISYIIKFSVYPFVLPVRDFIYILHSILHASNVFRLVINTANKEISFSIRTICVIKTTCIRDRLSAKTMRVVFYHRRMKLASFAWNHVRREKRALTLNAGKTRPFVLLPTSFRFLFRSRRQDCIYRNLSHRFYRKS